LAVGDALEFARVSASVSIAQLASAMRISPRAYFHIVAGDRALTFGQALRATDALAITTTELAKLVEASLGPWDRDSPATHDEVTRIHRRRMYQLLSRLEREDREGARHAREWLERRYNLVKDDISDAAEPGR
jgi:plasmid maintenance system antidote protein VapI